MWDYLYPVQVASQTVIMSLKPADPSVAHAAWGWVDLCQKQRGSLGKGKYLAVLAAVHLTLG